MKRVLKDYQQYFFLAGVVVLHLCDTRYVSKTAYEADQKAKAAETRELSEKLTQGLSDVKQSIALLNQNAEVLRDHESRLRVVEKLKL